MSTLEEITVTARRREENAQQVPVSITALSQATLENNNVQVLEDIQYLVPSLSVSQHANREEAEVSIRGQGPGSQNGQPAVSVYLNEVPLLSSYDGGLPGGPGLFFDLENVQVLKGPQGTLFGRNTVGGAVLLQTARPKDEFGGAVQTTYGNYNDREVDGAVNLPIVPDQLLARVAFNGQWRDGFTHVLSEPNHPLGVDLDNRDSQSVRFTLTYHPFEGFQNDVIWTYQTYKSNGTGSFITAIDPPTGPVIGPYAPGLYPGLAAALAQQQALGARFHIPFDTDTTGSRGRFSLAQNITRLDLNKDLTVRNIFGFSDGRFKYLWDADSTPLPIFNVLYNDYRTQQYTEELQVLGNSFGERLKWVAGLFYLDQAPPSSWGYDGFSRLNITLFSGTLINNHVDANRQHPEQSRALYTQGTYDLSSLLQGLKLTGGVRYTRDNRDQRSLGGEPGNPAVTNCPDEPAQRVNCDYLTDIRSHSSAVTYTASLDYQVEPGTLLYFTTRRGYRAGGANGASTAGVQLPNYSPEYVKDYEIGVKSDWKLGDVPVRTNADFFYQDNTNIQVSQVFVPLNSSPTNIVSNAAAARLWGYEAEILANLTPNLQVSLNGSHLNFRYTDFGPGVDSANLQLLQQGNRVPYQYAATVRYKLPIAASAGTVSVESSLTGQGRSGTFLTPYIIPSYWLVNASVNWNSILNSAFDASFFMSNVTDKTYPFGGVDVFGYQQTIYGDPRLYGLRIKYHFGNSN